MKIVIVKLSALGDIVHACIVLQFIKKYLPTSKIDWVCEEKFALVLENHKLINNVIKIQLKDRKIKESFRTLKNAKKNNYDLAIDLQGLLKSALVTRYLSKNTYGFDKNSIREKIASYFYENKFYFPYEENIILRNLKLIAFSINKEIDERFILDKKPCLGYFNEISDKITPEFTKKNILIILGSSWDSKIYPVNLQEKLINGLNNFNIYLSWNSTKEEKMAEYLSNKTNAKKLEKMNLRQLVYFIEKCNLIIGPDSGPTHLAWAQNKPSITIFGPTPALRNTFLTPINLVANTNKKINILKLNKNDDCIKNIKPELLVNMAKRLLDG